jgi:CheY-like chemotaxis protein
VYPKEPRKRSSGRIPVALPVRWHSPDGDLTMLQTENISTGGMLLRSACCIPTDRRIELLIALPGRNTELRAVAQARFVGPGPSGFAIGVEIIEMAEADRADWHSWCLRLPDVSASESEERVVAGPLRSTANILLVSSALAPSMLAALVASGCRVNVVCDPLEALSMLRERRDFEILICEVRRRDLDGRALCDLIKQERALRDVQVLLLAAPDSSRDVLDGLDAGATYVVHQPFTEQFLLSLITLCQRG